MTSEENLRELREANARLAARDRQRVDNLVLALSGQFAELRWLAKDYEEQDDGDWTR